MMSNNSRECEWIYVSSVDPITGNIFFEIQQNEKQKPASVYKYYALNENNCVALEKNYVYGSHPKQLNDSFDCSHDILSSQGITEAVKDRVPFTLEKKDPKEIRRIAAEEIYSLFGIFSTTTKCDNLPMWAHYTNNEGFCIEFNYSKFSKKFHGPFPLKYASQICAATDCGIHEMLLRSSTIKFLDWKYEDEWRFLLECRTGMFNSNNRKFSYPAEAIKRIILGQQFFHSEEIYFNENGSLNVVLKKNIAMKLLLLNILFERNIKLFLMLEFSLPFLGIKDRSYHLIKVDNLNWILKEY
jgi:hypothetical protein